MSDPLLTRRLLQACMDNYVEMFPVGLYPSLTVHDGPDLAYRTSGFPVSSLNSVVRFQASEEDADQRIDRMFAHFAEQGLPFNWVVTPASQPADLVQRLQGRGMTPAGTLVAMGRLLQDLPQLTCPAGLQVVEVQTQQHLQDWAWVGQQSYRLPEQAVGLRIQQFSRLLESRNWPLKLYVGYLKGEPVCTSGVRLTPHSAGLYFVGTLQGHTRKGHGAFITLHALQEAKQLGQEVGVLMSTQEGLQVYRRLGFEELGEFRLFHKQ